MMSIILEKLNCPDETKKYFEKYNELNFNNKCLNIYHICEFNRILYYIIEECDNYG